MSEVILALLEPLEDRCLMSASSHHTSAPPAPKGGNQVKTIEFSQAPAAVQTGLDNLATSDGLTDPTASQTVTLGDSGGIEQYSVDIATTGVTSVLTVDQNGNPVTAPTKSITTFGAITNTAVTDEINAIATALNLTGPISTTSVLVTTSGGTTTYTLTLGNSTSASAWSSGTTITVDSSGNPVGNINLPFSVIPTAIQDALNANAPAGATALSSTSTQIVQVRTADGVTTYSTTFSTTGIQTTVTVNSMGQLTNRPTTSTAQYQNIPVAAQTELQALATDNGYAGTISATQIVDVYAESSGTTIYTVTLPVSKSDPSGATYTVSISVSSDQNGNPTVPPNQGWGGFGSGGECGGGNTGGGGSGFFDFGGFSGGGGFSDGGFNLGGFFNFNLTQPAVSSATKKK